MEGGHKARSKTKQLISMSGWSVVAFRLLKMDCDGMKGSFVLLGEGTKSERQILPCNTAKTKVRAFLRRREASQEN